MNITENTRKIVRGYHDAWSERKDLQAARSFLAPDLKFRGSVFSNDDREAFLESLNGLLPIMISVQLLDEFYEQNRAFLFYDLETAAPAGTMRIAEHFIVENGKITEMKLVFDATEMHKMMAQSEQPPTSRPAYFVSFVQFDEPERFTEYSQLMMAAMMKYQALPIAHIDPAGVVPGPLPQAEVIEGQWPGITSVVKFASMEQLRAFCASEEFKRASEFRKQIAASNLAIAEEMPWPPEF